MNSLMLMNQADASKKSSFSLIETVLLILLLSLICNTLCISDMWLCCQLLLYAEKKNWRNYNKNWSRWTQGNPRAMMSFKFFFLKIIRELKTIQNEQLQPKLQYVSSILRERFKWHLVIGVLTQSREIYYVPELKSKFFFFFLNLLFCYLVYIRHAECWYWE